MWPTDVTLIGSFNVRWKNIGKIRRGRSISGRNETVMTSLKDESFV